MTIPKQSVKYMKRFYTFLVQKDINEYDKMLFIGGARQVGKTTITKQLVESNPKGFFYLNWDNIEDRTEILNYCRNILSSLETSINPQKTILVLDEIHKYDKWKDNRYDSWKNYVKGLYDKYHEKISIIVTGSSKLDTYKKGGDSMMGRYFNYTIFPLTIAEIADKYQLGNIYSPPHKIDDERWNRLYEFGGFPENYIQANKLFSNRWQALRKQQLLREDIQDLRDITNIKRLELLVEFLENQIGSEVNYTNLSNKVRVADQTIRSWIDLLEGCYFCFSIRPWSKNIPRSLLKEPKIYLYDWSQITDAGKKAENFVAVHLLKAVTFWNEAGLGSFGLHYLRDKEQHEVDFIVTKDGEPWFLLEVKNSEEKVSNNLKYFYERIKPEFAFNLVINMDYIEHDCFSKPGIWTVPAKTFLSQLI